MLDLSTLPHECIILDTCCIITLHASDHMASILESTQKQIVVASYVHETEVTKIDIGTFINSGQIIVTPLASTAEEITAVNFAASLEDGEAFTGAIAYHRNWAIATDEKKALNFFASNTPQLSRVTTPDFIHHWVTKNTPSPNIVRKILQEIQIRGSYIPGSQHHLRAWWQSYF